jgi:hypothetical protein
MSEDKKINPKQLLAPENYQNKWVDGLSDVEYHADKTSVSSSSLKEVEMISLKTFYNTFFISGGKEATKQMKFGKLAHLAILEGAKFKERYVVQPEFFGFTQKGEKTNSANCKEVKEKAAAWLADLPLGTIVTTAEERDKLFGMIDSLLSHAKASDFLKAGIAETSGYYRDPITGVLCRIRPDFMCRERRIITEFKTTEDCREEAFKYKINGEKYPLWYDFQLAMQCEGFKQIEKHPVELAAWVAINTHGAYEVAVHPMTIPTHDVGHIKYRRALTKLREAIDTNQWPGVQAPNDVSFIVPPDYILEKYGVNYSGDLI